MTYRNRVVFASAFLGMALYLYASIVHAQAPIVGTEHGGTGKDFSADAAGGLPFLSGVGIFGILGIGGSGQVLTVVDGLPAWAASGTGGYTFESPLFDSGGMVGINSASATQLGVVSVPAAGGLSVTSGAIREAQPITAIGSGLSLTSGTLSASAASAPSSLGAELVTNLNQSNSGVSATPNIVYESSSTSSFSYATSVIPVTTTTANDLVVISVTNMTIGLTSASGADASWSTASNGGAVAIAWAIIGSPGTYSVSVNAVGQTNVGCPAIVDVYSGAAVDSPLTVGPPAGATAGATSLPVSITTAAPDSLVCASIVAANAQTPASGYAKNAVNSTNSTYRATSMTSDSESTITVTAFQSAGYYDALAYAIAPQTSLVIDGVPLVAGSTTVLETNQDVASQDGIWLANSGAWTRPSPFSTGSIWAPGALCAVYGGLNYSGTLWMLTVPSAITVDTSVQAWTHTH